MIANLNHKQIISSRQKTYSKKMIIRVIVRRRVNENLIKYECFIDGSYQFSFFFQKNNKNFCIDAELWKAYFSTLSWCSIRG